MVRLNAFRTGVLHSNFGEIASDVAASSLSGGLGAAPP